jgi:hypothetical protein
MKCNPEVLFGIPPKVSFDEARVEAVKTGGYCRVSGEEIPGSSYYKRYFEGLASLFHEIRGASQDGEGRMALIQMTDLCLDPHCAKQSPSTDTKEQFLPEAQLRAAPIQFTGDPSMRGDVCRVVAVK